MGIVRYLLREDRSRSIARRRRTSRSAPAVSRARTA